MPHLLADSASDAFTVVGLLLTLVGLLATFFAVQISQWLMSLIEIEARWRAHTGNNSEASQDARRECRARLGGAYNPVVIVVTLPIAFFVAVTIYQSFKLLEPLGEGGAKHALLVALSTFSIAYFLLTLLLVGGGYLKGMRIKKMIYA